MVKKLLKHEFVYYVRTFGLFLPIVLVVGVMARVFQCFDDSNRIIRIAIFSSSAMLYVSCAVLLILSVVIGIVRFYTNLYSAEGYLSFTLPVTNAEHIFVKLLVSLACQAVCMVTVSASFAIAFSGEKLAEFWNELTEFTVEFFDVFGTADALGILLEITLLTLISAATNMLLYYACITIGQTAKKHRILGAVGAYFGYYVITQVISTLFVIVVTVMGASGELDKTFEWIAYNPIEAVHTYLCTAIVLGAGVGALFWALTQGIMSKKLNLE